MLNKNEIVNLKIFNDIYYKSCMFNPLITGVCSCGGNVMPFLANDLFSYNYSELKGFRLGSKNIKAKSDFDIINDMDIAVEPLTYNDNFIEKIKNEINNSIPVFTPINLFYWNKDSSYKTSNAIHFFLIYGYDDTEQNFMVVDTTKTTINYSEFMDSYKGYLDWSGGNKIIASKMFLKSDSAISKHTSKEYAIQLYKQNFINQIDNILLGIENIKLAAKYYNSCKLKPDLLLKDDEFSIGATFFPIDKAKEVEVYRIYKFFNENEDILGIYRNIYKTLSIIKGLLLKVSISGNVNDIKITSIVDKLYYLYELEIKYYNLMYNKLN